MLSGEHRMADMSVEGEGKDGMSGYWMVVGRVKAAIVVSVQACSPVALFFIWPRTWVGLELGLDSRLGLGLRLG